MNKLQKKQAKQKRKAAKEKSSRIKLAKATFLREKMRWYGLINQTVIRKLDVAADGSFIIQK